jgi:hypothetical protein
MLRLMRPHPPGPFATLPQRAWHSPLSAALLDRDELDLVPLPAPDRVWSARLITHAADPGPHRLGDAPASRHLESAVVMARHYDEFEFAVDGPPFREHALPLRCRPMSNGQWFQVRKLGQEHLGKVITVQSETSNDPIYVIRGYLRSVAHYQETPEVGDGRLVSRIEIETFDNEVELDLSSVEDVQVWQGA